MKFKMPPTLALMTLILLAATLAAYILPAGRFDRADKVIQQPGFQTRQVTVQPGDTLQSIAVGMRAPLQRIRTAEGGRPASLRPGMTLEVDVPTTGSRTVVVPGSYQRVSRQPDRGIAEAFADGLGMFFMAPVRGFQDKSQIIAFILLIGGAFGIILATGAVDRALHSVARGSRAAGNEWVIIAANMGLFSLGGAVFGMSEEVIPFVMITVPLAIRLGYDSITGVCMSFLAAGLGFAAAFLNPFTIGVAQGIAEVPVFSGMGFRLAVWIVLTTIGIAYVLWWAGRVRKRPRLSPTWENDQRLLARLNTAEQDGHFSRRDLLVLMVIALAIVGVALGVMLRGWYMNEISGVFVAAGLLAAVCGGMSMQDAASNFGKGVADLSGAAIIVAFSGGIVRVMEDGMVLDTILHGLAGSLDGLHATAGAAVMFVFQTCLNFFVPSGSGQAAMTMPILAPLSDLMGLQRQVAVLAFQFGDGFGNMIIPTSAVTMSVLSIAEIPWTRWARWLLPFELFLLAFGAACLALAVWIGYA